MCVCVWVGGWESQECGFENVKDAMVKNAGNWGSAFIWVKGGGLFLVLACSLFGEFKT